MDHAKNERKQSDKWTRIRWLLRIANARNGTIQETGQVFWKALRKQVLLGL